MIYFYFREESGIKLMLSILQSEGLGLISDDATDNQAILHDVDQLVSRFGSRLNQLDRVLQIYHQYAGSIAEGTKVGLLDEFDIQLCIRSLEGKLAVYHQDQWTRMISV